MATEVVREKATLAIPVEREALWGKIRSFLAMLAAAYEQYSARRLDYLEKKYWANPSARDRDIIEAHLHGLI